MGSLTKLETTLDGVLGDKAPVKLPQGARKGLAGAMWWLALVFGVLELWAAYGLWEAARRADRVADYVNTLSSYYGGTPTAANLGFFFYVVLLSMAIVAVMLLFAVPGLKAMKKNGWNLVFYAMLVEAVVAVASLFSSTGGFVSFLGAAIGAVIGAYLLFQIRSYFTGAKAEVKK